MLPKTPAETLASLGFDPQLLEYPFPAETGWCIHCFRVSLRAWDETKWGQPFKVNCIRDPVTSKRCQRCCHARHRCELPYEGIRGHGFELQALLEWVQEIWINEESGIGKGEDVGLVHDIEIVNAVAGAVRDLCSALDCLIKSHGKAHSLAGRHGGDAADMAAYTQYCTHQHASFQAPSSLGLRSDGTPHPKLVQFEHAARQYLRLETQFALPWYIEVLALKQTIEALIREKYDHSDPNIARWYKDMMAAFPLAIPLL
ncbi:unnamed protein product [Penicillium roqueforti FM164]|uniref:Uncharacterized protein n=1 Tax=Penicillium roqueforti (strain FM164) TaxID=1365484 RepID=W6QJJ1_PENRF|nr:unnamed protein product [Penicillium roqueforti FM164]